MDNKKGVKMKIYIFYHIFLCDKINDIIKEQINRLIESEILDSAELFVCITDIYNNQFPINEINLTLLKTYSNPVIEHVNKYELGTLTHLHEHAKNNDGYYLYFHTKGATRINHPDNWDNNIGYSYRNVENWRHIMEHFNIDQWRVCVESLDEGYDTVGCNYNSVWGQPHYSGNFWWAKSVFIKKLPQPMMFFDRMQGEMWISRVKHKSLCLYPLPEENHNRCYVYTPDNEYINNIIKNEF